MVRRSSSERRPPAPLNATAYFAGVQFEMIQWPQNAQNTQEKKIVNYKKPSAIVEENTAVVNGVSAVHSTGTTKRSFPTG
jgi:hypothetical protein